MGKKSTARRNRAMPVQQIKRFLESSVNLPNPLDYPPHLPAFDLWLNRWQRLFRYESEDETGNNQTITVSRDDLFLLAPIIRTTLSRLWREKDLRQRDWYCYRLRDVHRKMVRHLEGREEHCQEWGDPKTIQNIMDYALQEVPRISLFESAISWAQTNQKLMLYCANPLCETPYFFRTVKGQKFCSVECAATVRKEAKLKWWNENRKN
jgi:hypothetical protein